MSGFLDPIRAEDFEDGVHRKLLADITYHVGSPDSKDKIVIPKGFITDGGSVPQFAQGIVSRWGKASKAYVLHDYLYKQQTRSKLVCDAIFLEALQVLKVNWFQRWLIYRGVRLGGGKAFREHKREKAKKAK